MTEGVEVDRAVAALTAAQFGGGSRKDGCVVSHLDAVGYQYALDGTSKQVWLVSHKHVSVLDVYLEHLRVKLGTTFLDLLYKKNGIDFWVSVYVRYTDPNMDLGDLDTIVLHSGKRIVTSPVVFDNQLDALIDSIRERHITINRNLSGLCWMRS